MLTFAAYKIPALNEAMLTAARRGVEIYLIFESSDTGKTAFAAIEALGMSLSALCAEANSASTSSLRHEGLVRSITCLYASTGPKPF